MTASGVFCSTGLGLVCWKRRFAKFVAWSLLFREDCAIVSGGAGQAERAEVGINILRPSNSSKF